jgi:hypothetical protein
MSLHLPKKVTDFAATAVRTSLQFVEDTVERVRAGRGGETRPTPERPPAPDRTPASARAPRRPRAARAEAPVGGSPPVGSSPAAGSPPAASSPVAGSSPVAASSPAADLPPVDVVPEPTPGQAARIRAEQREAEQTEGSPGPEIHVDEPWPGYASMNAPEIIDRLRVSDDAIKAVVLLYERGHRARKTVLRAAGA